MADTVERYKINFLYIKLGGLILIPLVLLILPANFFDGGPDICLSKVFFNIKCWGCGLTRACMHLIHFKFKEAYFFNPISFVVFPIIAVLWAMEAVVTVTKLKAYKAI